MTWIELQFHKLIRTIFDINLSIHNKTVKTASYFQSKGSTPRALVSNVVYKLICLRDANRSHIGMTSRHSVPRAQEHLHSTFNETAITQHINVCSSCGSNNLGVGSFEILRQCNNDYETKIQEALLMKKLKSKLSIHFYSNSSSFLLNVY